MSDELNELSPQERAQVLLGRLKGNPSGVADRSESGDDHRHEQEAERPALPQPPTGTWDDDLIPKIEYNRSPEQEQLDALINSIDPIEAYIRFCGKMIPTPGSKTEGIMISCPMPGHADNNPSAWMNRDKKTWFCGGCQVGGDIYDLAAIHFGYGLNEYKHKSLFPILRQQIGEAFGLVIIKDGVTGQEYTYRPEPESSPLSTETESSDPSTQSESLHETSSDTASSSSPSNVVQLRSVQTESEEQEGWDDEELDLVDNPDLYIPWQEIAPENTFLSDWMKATTIDDLPHEYYFWLGLMGLGFAGGMNNYLVDYRPVKPNLYVCLYGRTGIGKSRAIEPFRNLLEEVFPYQEDPYSDPQGVKLLPTPNSAEAIIDSFHYEVKDSSTQKVDHMGAVSALLKHEELSGLIKKAERTGSSIKEVLIELYDSHGGDVTTHSRSTGIRKAHSPFCQMLSTTQPNAIHAFLRKTDVESGFLNRYVFAGGKGRIEPVPYGGFSYDLTAPIASLKDVNFWTFGGHRFFLQDQALKRWNEFFHENLSDYKAGRIDQESIFSRVDLTLKKIIVMLTINDKLDQPDIDVVNRALRLYPYLMLTYSMFSKDITYNDVTDCQNHLLKICKRFEKRGKQPTARDFYKFTNGKYDSEMMTRALKNLVDVGLMQTLVPQPGQRGRPVLKYATVT